MEQEEKKSNEGERSSSEEEARLLGEEDRDSTKLTDKGHEMDHRMDETEEHEERERDRSHSRSPSRSRSRSRSVSPPRSLLETRSDRGRSREPRGNKERSRKKHSRRNKDAQPTELIGQLQSYLDTKFTDMKRDLLEEQDSMAARLNKRLKPEHEFKRKTNRFQYDHNNEVTDTMKKVRKQLVKNPPNIRKAVSTLDEGIYFNNFRTKCILMADKAEGGWATVEEYLQRELASDSEDDKRMRKAEQTVAKKFEQKKKSKPYKPRYQPYNKNYSQQNYNNNSYNDRNSYSNNGYNHNSFNNNSGNGFRKPGRYRRGCFICGDMAHWKDACPRNFMPSAAAGAPQ